MTRNCLLLALLPLAAPHAAIIRGNVVEHATGKVLARAQVGIQPITGTNGPTLSLRTDSYGNFSFINIPAGAYLVNASRRGFATVQYGQKQWKAAGRPVIVEQEQDSFLTIRLPRFGSISGVVIDENDVGMPEHEVVVYRNTRPPKVVAKLPADDRGIYRIWGLEPGSYLVRTLGRRYEDGDYLPTFYRDTLRTEQALAVDVNLDMDTPDVRIRPFPGKLLSISGSVNPCTNPPQVVTLTLASDTGRETISTGGSFQFFGKPPGNYEIFAESPDRRIGLCGAYMPLALENRDAIGLNLSLVPLPTIAFLFEGVPALNPDTVKILARRKDMAGEAEPVTLRLRNGQAQLNPGRWDVQVAPAAGYVAVDFRGPKSERPENGRADGWNEITVTGPGLVKFVLSTKPGGIHGVVTGALHEPAPGAPVILESYDPEGRKRINELRIVRADLTGHYQFGGLAPGTYRVIGTFDLQAPETREIDAMNPRTVKVEEGRDSQEDIDLTVLR